MSLYTRFQRPCETDDVEPEDMELEAVDDARVRAVVGDEEARLASWREYRIRLKAELDAMRKTPHPDEHTPSTYPVCWLELAAIGTLTGMGLYGLAVSLPAVIEQLGHHLVAAGW